MRGLVSVYDSIGCLINTFEVDSIRVIKCWLLLDSMIFRSQQFSYPGIIRGKIWFSLAVMF
jgi:hypothetical protein